MMNSMCFSIPYKVVKVGKDNVIIEGGKVIRIDHEIDIKKGSYVQVVGDVVVDALTRENGLRVRKLIKRLN
jgi:hydrogenase maturation factor